MKIYHLLPTGKAVTLYVFGAGTLFGFMPFLDDVPYPAYAQALEDCHSIRHAIGDGGYQCELKLKKNALDKGAGDKSIEVKGKLNDQEAPPTTQEEPPPMVTIDADSGQRLLDRAHW